MTPSFACRCAVATIVLLLAARSGVSASDEIPPDQGAAGLYHALLQLKTTLKVMHIVAHPDDEDGAMLTYCARGLGAKTMLFSVTRGEGGANLISKHAFDELGILRTLEHEESAKYYGVEVCYSSAADYGYSKTLDEANAHWGRDERVLKDLVAEIRLFKPDVIVSRFRGDARDGHGHHQFAGVMAQQAFEAAAKADRLPGVSLEPWQPQKLYANNIQPDWRPEDKDAWTVAVPTGEFNSVLGRSYAQVARFGLGFQRSQGFSGHDGPAGESVSYYRLTKTKLADSPPKNETSFADGLDASIVGLAKYAGDAPPDWLVSGLKEMQSCADRSWGEFDPRHLDAVAPALIDGAKAAHALIEQLDRTKLSQEIGFGFADRVLEKDSQFHFALRRALGIDLDVLATTVETEESSDAGNTTADLKQLIPGQMVQVTLRVVHRSKIPIEIVRGFVSPEAEADWGAKRLEFKASPLEYNKPWSTTLEVRLPDDMPPTRPAWRRSSIAEPFYEDDDSRRKNQADRPMGMIFLSVNGLEMGMWRPFQVRYHDPAYGDVKQPVEIVPRISVSLDHANAILVGGQRQHTVNVSLRNGAREASEGLVALVLPKEWRAEPTEQSFSLSGSDEAKTYSFTIHGPATLDRDGVTIQAVATCAGREYTEGYETITARDLGRANYYRPAQQRLHAVDFEVPADLRVGYVMGAGDEIPAALAQLGVSTTLLDTADLASGDLQRFDTIMIGIRAYAVRADLVAANPRLLEYVKNGGNLVVYYQTPEFDRNYGPFPYKMGRNPEEVSEENAKVTILSADHPLLTAPNRIALEDFDGWFEQRGSKFWQTWNERYEPLLKCHDENQPEQSGGLLYAKHGRGTYTYCAYALYRQLPQGVPGAYRLLANLAAHGRTAVSRE